MIKPQKIGLCLGIFLFSFFVTTNSHAIPIKPILESFEQMFKFLKKGADEIPDAGKKMEDLKGIDKSDNVMTSSETSKKFGDQINDFNLNYVSELKNSGHNKLLEIHGVKNGKRLSEVIDKSDIDINEFLEENAGINIFRTFWWSGRIFRTSNSFNKPEEDRLVIECKKKNENFYFTALLENEKKWLLLSANIKKESDYKEIERQKLYVLVDKDEYIIFSTTTPKDRKYPLNYFIIANDGKFLHEFNMNGTDSPRYLINNADKKILKSNFYCTKL